ncbi:MAG: hypothetical protein K8J08_16920 [Thermoanaerobaculia bacterium]|nr:hypothetical protein [Thermoanaerobaculia bacterium]
MIRRKTVFILGAGASKPYGFPSGLGLLRKVLALAKRLGRPSPHGRSNQEVRDDYLDWFDITIDERRNFAERLENTGFYSVDAFVEQNRDFERIAKVLIAAHLIGCENPEYLRKDHQGNGEIKGDWYRYLFNSLIQGGYDRYSDNSVSFVSLNYDRSLEAFLLSSLSGFGRPQNEVEEQFNSLPIIHVYGDLGPLVGDSAASNGRIYNDKVSFDTIGLAIENLKLMGDARSEVAEAVAAIQEAERIVFLGFGFHKLNLQRLRFSEPLKARELCGTAMDIPDADMARIRSWVASTVDLDDMNRTSYEYLRWKFGGSIDDDTEEEFGYSAEPFRM